MVLTILLEVYVNLLDQKEPKLNFEKANVLPISTKNNKNKSVNYSKKITKITEEEINILLNEK